MKKSLFVVLVVAILTASGIFTLRNSNKLVSENTVLQKSSIPKTQRFQEAAEWRMSKLVNPETGVFNVEDYYAAIHQADLYKQVSSKKSGALNLSWEVLGPDNQGGRTRALMFDKLDANTLWAGSVGGGLFKSTNNGNSWNRVEGYSGFFPIASIAQDNDGVLYVGTGEGLSQMGGSSFNSGNVGNGIWKSTDGGNSWYHLPGTDAGNDPSVVSTSGWAGVNDLAVSPINNNLILAATQNGLKVSTIGGEDTNTWISATGLSGTGQSVEITKNGQIAYATFNGRVYRSLDVSNDFKTGWQQMPVTGGQRADIAIAPSNNNVVYASVSAGNFCMSGLWRSTDGGDNWTQIQAGGSPYVLDPFNQPTVAFGDCQGQGWYDHTIAVNPADENKLYIGGITLYTWGDGVGLRRADKIDTEGGTPFNSDYIHADKHEIIFDPKDLTGNKMLIGSDGGVTLCNNANIGFPDNLNYIQKNKGYVTTQVYGMGAGKVGEVLSGNQDNGSQYINGILSSSKAAMEVTGGDGMYGEVSHLDPDVLFTGVYYGAISRSVNRGLGANAFVSDIIDPMGCGQITRCTNSTSDCSAVQDAPFVYPFFLLETEDVGNQLQTAVLSARNDTLLLASGATQIIRDTLYPTYKVTTTREIKDGNDTTYQVVTDITSDSPYQAVSATSDLLKVPVTLTSTITPGNSEYFNDPYDAKYFVPSDCGLWMCTNPLQKNQEPLFYRISPLTGITSFDASADGDKLYFVTSNRLYIVSGLNQINASLNPLGCSSNAVVCAPSLVTIGPITITGAPATLEGVCVDKHNDNTVLVVAAGFSQSSKVFRVENALGSPTITALQTSTNGLPYMPLYDCLIDFYNPDRYIISSELGIWTSNDAGATWTEDNNGLFGRMPIYRLRQEYLYEKDCMVIYAGTHGGGMFRTTSLTGGNCDLVPYQWEKIGTSIPTVANKNITLSIALYPNPASSNVNLTFDLTSKTKISAKVFDLTGRLVVSKELGDMNAGEQTIDLNIDNLTSGNYYAVLYANTKMAGSRLFVKK